MGQPIGKRRTPITNLDLLACYIYHPLEFHSLVEEWANQQDQRSAELIEVLKCQ